jgi:tetratricopeptide (TPR) repeat protein
VAAGDVAQVSVPPTIQALLSARLDMLGPDERVVLECGSVEGKVFHRSSVAALVPEAVRPRVGDVVTTLQRRELLRPERAEFAGQEAYRFRHQLIRDAAYNGMSKERRASQHEAFAAWLDEQAAGAHEYQEILGYHLEQAARFRAELGPVDEAGRGLAARAAAALAAAGHRALARGDAPAAANLLERAMNLLPPGDRERLELVPRLADALIETGELARARALCDLSLEEAISVADPLLEMRIRVERMFVVGATDPDRYWIDVPDVIAEARPLFERAADHRSLAALWSLEGLRLNMVGHPQEMLEANERALEQARLAQDLRAELVCQRELANTTYWGTTPAEAGLRRLDDVLEQVRGHRLVEASVDRNRAAFLAMQGRFDEAREILRTARATFEEHGATLMVLTNSFMSGPMELWAGDPVAAERELRESCEAFEAMGERAWLCSLASFLAESLYQQGRYDEAEEWTRRAEETAGQHDLSAHADIRAVRAKVMAQRGEFEVAESLAREAVEIGARTSEPDHEGDNYFDLAEVLRLAGKPMEAVEALEQALRHWEAKGNLVSAAKARSSIEELTST